MKKHFLKSLLALSVAASMTVTFVPATYAAEVTAFDDSVDEEVSLDEDTETVEEQTSVFPEDESEIQIDEEADESDSDEIILDETEPEEAAEQTDDAPAQELEEALDEPSALETALTFVDQDAAALVQAIGEPLETQYEASCSGPGDDGVWTYDGFTVYTYRENGVETIVDAE